MNSCLSQREIRWSIPLLSMWRERERDWSSLSFSPQNSIPFDGIIQSRGFCRRLDRPTTTSKGIRPKDLRFGSFDLHLISSFRCRLSFASQAEIHCLRRRCLCQESFYNSPRSIFRGDSPRKAVLQICIWNRCDLVLSFSSFFPLRLPKRSLVGIATNNENIGLVFELGPRKRSATIDNLHCSYSDRRAIVQSSVTFFPPSLKNWSTCEEKSS